MNTDLAVANTTTRPELSARTAETLPKLQTSPVTVAPDLPDAAKVEAKKANPPSTKRLDEALAHLNDMMKKSNRNLSFAYDRAIINAVITVKDTITGEVIRQIPSESILRIAHSIEELKGLLHNEKI